MPIDFKVHPQARRLESRGSGSVTDADLAEYVKAYRDDPHFDPSFDELLDLSAVEAVHVTARGLRRIADEMRQRDPMLPGARIAVVAPADVVFGLARLYQSNRDGSPDEIRVFRERSEAEAWLDEPGPRGKGRSVP